MKKDENRIINRLSNPWEFGAYLVKYRLKELLAIIIVMLIGAIMLLNVSYDKENGLRWRPAATIEIKQEVKK